MLCPKCGFYHAKQKTCCLKCGHTLNARVYEKPEIKWYLIDLDIIRVIIYLGLMCFIYMLFYKMYYFYVEAENNRVNMVIKQQFISEKERIALAEFEKHH